ncbi:MAG: hypothetical protein K9M07_04340 [Simkaniaceae bacterium]|nr:hypothetical protein [Simkaniaceae bacterium]
MTTIAHAFMNVLFPTECLICHCILDGWTQLICQTCFASLQRISFLNRCLTCLSPLLNKGSLQLQCHGCKRRHFSYHRLFAVVIDDLYSHPLIQSLNQTKSERLAKLLASFLAVQIECDPDREFDVIIPHPHQADAYLLSKKLSAFLEVPLMKHPKQLRGPMKALYVIPYIGSLQEINRNIEQLKNRVDIQSIDLACFTAKQIIE